jgi:phosphatidylglycerol---prolipoprotein diacylglyceryl transferase
MYPELFRLGGLTLYTYGVIVAIAFAVGWWMAGRLAAKNGLDAGHVSDLAIWTLLAGLVGARLMLLGIDWREYLQHPRELIGLLRSAGVFYGGLIAALPVAFWLLRSYKLPAWPTLDVLAPALVLAQSIGRLGCLAAGCCYGRRCDTAWAITFKDAALSRTLGTPVDVPLYPTQIYESLATLAIFFLLLWMLPRKKFHGQIVSVYLVTYAVARFIIELYRGDPRGSVFGGALSTSQFIGILVVLGVLGVLPYLWKRQRVAPPAAPQS